MHGNAMIAEKSFLNSQKRVGMEIPKKRNIGAMYF